MFNIGFINNSSAVSNGDLKKWIAAIWTQVGRDFATVWGTYAALTFPAAPYKYQPLIFPLYLCDATDVDGALGYHDVDADGVPFIKVFARTSLDNGVPVSSVISHEILEVLADPMIYSTALVQRPSGASRIYAMEACDPVEEMMYMIDGVQVSNFVTPEWFRANSVKTIGFDHLGALSAPLSRTEGGYFSFMDIPCNTGWSESAGSMKRKFSM